MNSKKHENLTNSFWELNSIKNIFGRKQTITHFKNNTSSKSNTILKKFIGFCFVMALLLSLSGCKQPAKTKGPEYADFPDNQNAVLYSFAVYPIEDSPDLLETYQPLLDYLNTSVKGTQIVLEPSDNYKLFEQKYQKRKPDFLLANPWQTLQAIKSGYHVIAMAENSIDLKGFFVVRRDSEIQEPADLKGKKVSYPAPTAFDNCILQQYYLYTHGIDVNKDITNWYVGSQESTLLNVFYKKTAAGTCWSASWKDFDKEYPEKSIQLKVLWETELITSNSVMVRNDVPAKITNQVQNFLVELDKSPKGKKLLDNLEETFRFVAATNHDYDGVKKFINQFEKEVRKIDVK